MKLKQDSVASSGPFALLGPLGSALFFAAAVSGTLALGAGMIWRALERESAGFIQQSIGDTASLVAEQSRMEIARLSREIVEGNGRAESQPEILDLSLWRKADSAAPARRERLAINPRFASPMPDALPLVQALEETDLARIEPAFRGEQVVLFAPIPGVAKPLALIAIPMPRAAGAPVTEVASARVSVERLAAAFAVDGMVASALVDSARATIAQSGARMPLAPLLEALDGGPAGAAVGRARLESDLRELQDEQGRVFYGGYRRIPDTGLAVLSSVPPDQGASSLDSVRNQLLATVLLAFVALAIGRYAWLRRREREGLATEAIARESGAAAVPDTSGIGGLGGESVGPARRILAVSLHGSLRGFKQLVDDEGPDAATETLNDYLTCAAALARSIGRARFECSPGASFQVSWEVTEGESARVAAEATQLVAALREELARLNGGRAVDGKAGLSQGMGLHAGQALLARIGASPELRWSVTGEAPACARALDRLALAHGQDCVVSRDFLVLCTDHLAGAAAEPVAPLLGEERLTADTGLTPFHAWPGSAPADARLTGGETRIGIATGAPAALRWLVNNGSQIVGPLDARGMSRMLFAQEIDFDCECWSEETGAASRVGEARIFTGSEDAGARYWVYDGELVHGMLSEGFIRTAVERGAIPEQAWVCERSSLAGWRKLSELLVELAAATGRKPDTDSGPRAA